MPSGKSCSSPKRFLFFLRVWLFMNC